jgi:hypothetical protein
MSRVGDGRDRALGGLVRLLAEATRGVADVAESVHLPIARVASRVGGPVVHGPVVGVARLAYHGVRGVAGLARAGSDAWLARKQASPDGGQSAALAGADVDLGSLDGLRAALNGVLGDHLAATGNPLAIPMQLVIKEAQHSDTPRARSGMRLLVMVHGLCMSDRQWQRPGQGKAAGDDPHRPQHDQDHGAMLAHAGGWTRACLRYNTGLPIARNGRAFADALATLVAESPVPVERIAIVGHSMGGLVARSAVHHATACGQDWVDRLQSLVFLGTPHHGAPLERWGHRLERALAGLPPLAPFASLARVRSAGITDLRHGTTLDDDSETGARHVHAHDRRTPLPLPRHVACYGIAASLARAPQGKATLEMVDGAVPVPPSTRGDGLVPVASALGQHPESCHHLRFPRGHLAIAWGLGHIALLGSPAVGAQLQEWIG